MNQALEAYGQAAVMHTDDHRQHSIFDTGLDLVAFFAKCDAYIEGRDLPALVLLETDFCYTCNKCGE